MSKKTIDCYMDIGDSILNVPLKDVIKALQKFIQDNPDKPDLQLEMHWTGYEDCSLEFYYTQLETDKEYKERLYAEQLSKELKEKELKAKEERDKKLKQLQRLKAELGIR